tara:strand:+ start:60 stop:365 length:306 start_codon:yes stop_codon:yes gene_type:complete
MTYSIRDKALDLLKERDLTELRMKRAESTIQWLTPQSWNKMSRKEQIEIVRSGEIQFPYNMELRERLYRAVDEAKRQWRMDRRSVLELNAHKKRRNMYEST